MPLQLQKAVFAEINGLMEAGHIRKNDKTTDQMFIQPVVITVKKDRIVKIALDARSHNNAFLESKHRMPNLENLMENISEIVYENNGAEVLFSSLDMLYAYGQTVLPHRYCQALQLSNCGG